MKLIAEYTDQSLEILTEEKEGGRKKYSSEGRVHASRTKES